MAETTSSHQILCTVCGGRGIDPTFGDECAPCGGTGYKRTAVTMPAAGEARPSGPSDKQIAFFTSLLDQNVALNRELGREFTDEARQLALDTFLKSARKDASRVIDSMLQRRGDLKIEVEHARQAKAQAEALQRKQDRAAGRRNADDVDGMYQLPDGRIVKVQYAAHGSGKPYAKLLTDNGEDAYKRWTFEYVPGLMRECRPEHRMTLEQAKAFGALYGTCCVCGATLTSEVSIEAGIGPVCAGRLA